MCCLEKLPATLACLTCRENNSRGFQQSVSLWRGSRVIVLEIEIADCSMELAGDAWNSYLACRFAWPDEAATIRRSIHGCIFETKARRFEAPQFIEVESYKTRTTILTAGMPYHRRIGKRMLDCLLRTRGESSTKFRLGIGIDVPHACARPRKLCRRPFVIAEQALCRLPVQPAGFFTLIVPISR